MNEKRYELLGRVAETSSAIVWKARDTDLDRLVALKQLQSNDPQLRARWRAEAQALAAVDDPHVVAVYGLIEDEDATWLVEEWIEGATLAAVSRQSGPLQAQEALTVIRGALQGLEHAHSQGIVHRDLSLSNIMLRTTGESVLIDFGFAAPWGADGLVGTAAFQSPEALAGQPVTGRSDIYSMAAVLAYLLTGQRAVPDGLSTIERPIREVIERATALDPRQRYATAGEFLAALEEAARERYGAAWLAQAGVATLVSTTATAALVSDLTGGPAGAVTHPLLPDESAVPTSPPTEVALGARRKVLRPRVLVGGGALVAVALIILIVLLATGGSSTHPVPVAAASGGAAGGGSASTAQPSATPTPSHVPTPADGISGRYSMRAVIVASSEYNPSSTVFTDTWTITATCKAAGCAATSRAAQGPALLFRLAGDQWVSTTPGPYGCVNPAQHVTRVTERTTLEAQPAPSGEPPPGFRGSQSVNIAGQCPSNVQFVLTLTRIASGAPHPAPRGSSS